MKDTGLLAAIEASPRTGRLGLPSRIAEGIDGKPVLFHTAQRLLGVEGVAEVWIVTSGSEAGAVRSLLEGLPVRFFCSDEPDIPSRERLRRGRLWALGSWRGGLKHSFFGCESGRPGALRALLEKRRQSHLILAPAEAPLLAPELVEELVAAFRREGREKKLYLATSPPGLSADLYSADILEVFAASGRSLDGALDFRPDSPEHWTDAFGFLHWYANTITSLRARLCADTDRSFNLVTSIVRSLGSRWQDGTAEQLTALLRNDQRLLAGDFPQELVLELTSRRNHVGPADGPPDTENDLPPERIQSLLEECAGRNDVRFSLGIRGEPLRHPRIVEILGLFAQERPFGLHVHTDALAVTDEILAALAAADPDVVSVSLDATSPETYQRLHGIDGYQRAIEGANRLGELLLPRGRFLVPEFARCALNAGEVEAFYDAWYAKTGWVTVTDHDDRAGRVASLADRYHLPPDREACAHLSEELAVLPDGAFALCRQDLEATTRIGEVGRDAIQDVWHTRALHCRFCEACKSWAF